MRLGVLLIFHVLGDFVFQSSKTAQAKQRLGKEGRLALCRHLAVYTAFSLLAVLWWGNGWNILLNTLLLSVSHAVVDTVCIRLRRVFPRKGLLLFACDQAIHAVFLLGVSRMLGRLNAAGIFVRDMLPASWGRDTCFSVMLAVLLVLICTAPAAVLVKEVFSLIAAHESEEKTEPVRQVDVYRSGYVIGVCERLVILVLGVAGQFGAIGFVLAAKSLARFKLLNDDKDFAERYLVGTLVSALSAMVCVLIWNQLT
ncbi:MAG: DUF3307 domain-containing protein [Clostridiales bacterium]|nr:DUF3307 domain-containing protein [Clostridiales bacterium]